MVLRTFRVGAPTFASNNGTLSGINYNAALAQLFVKKGAVSSAGQGTEKSAAHRNTALTRFSQHVEWLMVAERC